jgi:thiol-disulfide isomerase/thioredoxin
MDTHRKTVPINVEEIAGFNAASEAAIGDGKTLVLTFVAEWCGSCKTTKPLIRQFSKSLSDLAVFLVIDIDENEEIANNFNVSVVPTIMLLRDGNTLGHIKEQIKGGGPDTGSKLAASIFSISSEKDLMNCQSKQNILSHTSMGNFQVSREDLYALSISPLSAVFPYLTSATRQERGLSTINGKLSGLCDLEKHSAASTGVAKKMIRRLQEDMLHYAESENKKKEGYIKGLSEIDLGSFFEKGEMEIMHSAKSQLHNLLKDLNQIHDYDAKYVAKIIPFLCHVSNFVDTSPLPQDVKLQSMESNTRDEIMRTIFVLKQICGQVPRISIEFLFGATLSTRYLSNINSLNPYLGKETVNTLLQLVTIAMIRSNRIGHTNRCISQAQQLLTMVENALELGKNIGSEGMEDKVKASKGKIVQASTTLANGILSKRHFMCEGSDYFSFDPRFLLFEFIWNILLRKKQVEI